MGLFDWWKRKPKDESPKPDITVTLTAHRALLRSTNHGLAEDADDLESLIERIKETRRRGEKALGSGN